MTASPFLELIGASREHAGPPVVTALQPATLQIGLGELVAIVGPSGAGKTTLLNLLGLLDRPSTGSYLIDGVQTGALREQELAALRAATFGFVFQAFHLMSRRTVVENVAMPLQYQGVDKGLRRERARTALATVGLAGLACRLPTELSGGERQRVSLARALAGDPKVLLCDEPTGNLDSGNSRRIVGELRQIALAGRTVVIVTHDEAVAASADRSITVIDGVVRS